jgi:ribosomal protein L19E
MPARDYVQRLHTRNEWLIKSHKPLRETLFKLAGKREIDRKNYLLTVYKEASTFTNNPRPWSTPLRAPSIF